MSTSKSSSYSLEDIDKDWYVQYWRDWNKNRQNEFMGNAPPNIPDDILLRAVLSLWNMYENIALADELSESISLYNARFSDLEEDPAFLMLPAEEKKEIRRKYELPSRFNNAKMEKMNEYFLLEMPSEAEIRDNEELEEVARRVRQEMEAFEKPFKDEINDLLLTSHYKNASKKKLEGGEGLLDVLGYFMLDRMMDPEVISEGSGLGEDITTEDAYIDFWLDVNDNLTEPEDEETVEKIAVEIFPLYYAFIKDSNKTDIESLVRKYTVLYNALVEKLKEWDDPGFLKNHNELYAPTQIVRGKTRPTLIIKEIIQNKDVEGLKELADKMLLKYGTDQLIGYGVVGDSSEVDASDSEMISEEDDECDEVAAIIDHKFQGGKWLYKVEWSGGKWGREDSWVLPEEIQGCETIIAEYREINKDLIADAEKHVNGGYKTDLGMFLGVFSDLAAKNEELSNLYDCFIKGAKAIDDLKFRMDAADAFEDEESFGSDSSSKSKSEAK